ncbi:MAG TPA: HEPN domain-containing protein, partial [Desulfomonilaceae bacterium]|nr:HEPN domain-containing protein [Desulfomonilaceae bacterium]
MTSEFTEEIAANLQRAEQSIQAARQLASNGFHDFAASRAYYAAFYAATALLLHEGLEFGKHGGVIAAIHHRFVKTGKLDKERGKALNWLFEVRSVGDYGGTAHISIQEVEQAIEAAEEF